jgi:hypothetical protein
MYRTSQYMYCFIFIFPASQAYNEDSNTINFKSSRLWLLPGRRLNCHWLFGSRLQKLQCTMYTHNVWLSSLKKIYLSHLYTTWCVLSICEYTMYHLHKNAFSNGNVKYIYCTVHCTVLNVLTPRCTFAIPSVMCLFHSAHFQNLAWCAFFTVHISHTLDDVPFSVRTFQKTLSDGPCPYRIFSIPSVMCLPHYAHLPYLVWCSFPTLQCVFGVFLCCTVCSLQ